MDLRENMEAVDTSGDAVDRVAVEGPADSGGGDLEARFRALVEDHQDSAIRTARRLLGGDAASEDVAQEAFLRAYRGLPRFRGESSIRTWFFRILVREVQRHQRWQGLRRIWTTVSISDRELPDTASLQGDSVLRGRIVSALSELPARQRDAFVFVYLEEWTYKEAAEVLGVSVGTVKVHVHRAVKALKKSLGDLRPAAVERSGDLK